MSLSNTYVLKKTVSYSTDGRTLTRLSDGRYADTSVVAPDSLTVDVSSLGSNSQRTITVRAIRHDKTDNTQDRHNGLDLTFRAVVKPGAQASAAQLKETLIEFMSFINASYDDMVNGNI